MDNTNQENKKINRLIMWPFEGLDIQEPILGDKYVLNVMTIHGHTYGLVFLRRNNTGVNEYFFSGIIDIYSFNDAIVMKKEKRQ